MINTQTGNAPRRISRESLNAEELGQGYTRYLVKFRQILFSV